MKTKKKISISRKSNAFQRINRDDELCRFLKHKTQSIKKCSVKSFNANDRSKKILINFAFVFFKIDNFHQLKIQIFNRNIRQNHFKTFQ